MGLHTSSKGEEKRKSDQVSVFTGELLILITNNITIKSGCLTDWNKYIFDIFI